MAAMNYGVDDIKMSNQMNEDNSGNSSSSDDDSGIVMSKEMRQMTKLHTQISKNLSKIQSIRSKLNNPQVHQAEKVQFEASLVKINIALAKLEQNQVEGSQSMKNELKQLKKENKQVKKLFQSNQKTWKMKSKEEKQIVKNEKKLEKEKKKQARLEFRQTLEKAKIEELPIKEQKLLEIWVDGWNISGCFGGRSRSKSKLIDLLQQFYEFYQLSAKDNKFSHLNNIELFYDGNGKDKLDKNVNVTHSGKNVIVDDLWIDLLSNQQKNGINTSHIVCITSDRELTVRLYNIGIPVMKSGTFFKTYLKPLMPQQETQNDKPNAKGKNFRAANNNGTWR